MCSDPYAKIFPLANRSTDWQSGQPFDVQVNLLANGKIWHMDQPTSQPRYLGQPTGKVVSQCTKFTMLIPSTKLLVYPANRPIYSSSCPCVCRPLVTLAILCSRTVVLVLFLALSPPAAPARSGPGVRFTKAISVWVLSGHKFPVMLINVAVH